MIQNGTGEGIPKVSIIIPVYNVEKYLNRCIKSILKQTFRDFELILVDDGSPDKCPQLCDDWCKKDKRIWVIHKENGGQSSARNVGLEAARGEYIGFVDSDDWIEKDMLQLLYDSILKCRADISMCDYVIDKGMKKKKQYLCQTGVKCKMLDKKGMLEYFFRIHGEKSNYSVCGKLLKCEVLKEFQFIEGRMNEDVDACYHFFKNANRCIIINAKRYHYFQNRNGITLRKFTDKDFDLLYIWNLIIKYVRKDFPEYSYYAEINRKRSYFTLLTKMERDYFKGNKELKCICKKWQGITRRHMLELFRWKMPITRKILLLIECFIPI